MQAGGKAFFLVLQLSVLNHALKPLPSTSVAVFLGLFCGAFTAAILGGKCDKREEGGKVYFSVHFC